MIRLLFALVEEFGIDGRSDYERHIVEGHPPAPVPNAFGADYAVDSGRFVQVRRVCSTAPA